MPRRDRKKDSGGNGGKIARCKRYLETGRES